MHPQEFVAKMISEGRTIELADMIRQSAAKHYEMKAEGHESAYGFVNMFMISVVGQLRLLQPGQTLEDDDVLRVWRSLGLWGLKREEIAKYLDNAEIL